MDVLGVGGGGREVCGVAGGGIRGGVVVVGVAGFAALFPAAAAVAFAFSGGAVVDNGAVYVDARAGGGLDAVSDCGGGGGGGGVVADVVGSAVAGVRVCGADDAHDFTVLL